MVLFEFFFCHITLHSVCKCSFLNQKLAWFHFMCVKETFQLEREKYIYTAFELFACHGFISFSSGFIVVALPSSVLQINIALNQCFSNSNSNGVHCRVNFPILRKIPFINLSICIGRFISATCKIPIANFAVFLYLFQRWTQRIRQLIKKLCIFCSNNKIVIFKKRK